MVTNVFNIQPVIFYQYYLNCDLNVVNGNSSFFCALYIYAFNRRLYPKRLTMLLGYTFFISMSVPWELNPQPFALVT